MIILLLLSLHLLIILYLIVGTSIESRKLPFSLKPSPEDIVWNAIFWPTELGLYFVKRLMRL